MELNRELLAELLLRWEELYEQGQDIPASELAKEHPELIDELARRIQNLKAISWIDTPIDDEYPDDVYSGDLCKPKESYPLAPRTLAGRYRLGELIAEGGFAKVFKGFDSELERIVAIKVPKASKVASRESFQAEAKRVAGLKHEGIVPVFDVGLEGDTYFIVTEFVEGGSLAERLWCSNIGVADAVGWTADIGDALEYAHSRGVIHLDIKPANIVMNNRGRARLTDFGISRSGATTAEFAPSLGTLHYMSPEQLEGKPADRRTDIYSLAVVLFEAINGETPHSSSEPHLLRKEIVLGQKPSWTNDCPLALRQVVEKALSRDPDQRHSSAAEFTAEIRKAIRPKPPRWDLVRLGGLFIAIVLAGLAPKIQRWFADPPKKADQIPGQLLISGIGDEKTLKGSLPSSWIKEGVFAEIKGAGVVEFPRLPISAFVLELDLETRNPRGLISFFTGEDGNTVDLKLGSLWPKDAEQTEVPCRLFRGQPWGVNWIGEAHLPANQRMTLKLVVNDDFKALVREGNLVLGASGDAADFKLTIATDDKANATIYRATCRAITAEDAKEADQLPPTHDLDCDTAATRQRLASQSDVAWSRTPVAGEPFVINDMDMPMRWIEPGDFTMGTPYEHLPQMGAGRERVRISHGYWIGAYEVTQGQWQNLMASNPSRVTGSPYLPVNNISRSDAQSFCELLTARERRVRRCPRNCEYRLPTEAEWEFACRCGGDEPFVIPLREIAMRGNRYFSIVEVGTTPPNHWGLHEMIGNVPEWCLDSWRDYSGDETKVVIDRYHPGNLAQSAFVLRGNGFWITEMGMTSFSRTRRIDVRGGFRGFRVVLAPVAESLANETIAVEKTD
jgi:serine/threonine protein kinase/formylglycine-generating enzyme required for sulfatase activity